MLGISPATGWRKVKTDPRFPRPVALGPMSTAFVHDEVQAYIESLIAERDEGRNPTGGRAA
jgi:predicted DNA-binding transcriptional regulator AlpA